MAFWKNLTQPHEVEERTHVPPAPNPIGYGLLMAFAADLFAGHGSTFGDKAAFVAYPFALGAIAQAGAEKGASEWEGRVQE